MFKNKPVLQGTNLSLSFKGIQALSEINFHVREKEILGIVGPNGSGKTCILNIISGFYKPQQGEIIFENRNLIGMKPFKIAKLGIGRSFQQMELFGGMTVLENILLGCHPLAKGDIFSAGIYWGPVQRRELFFREIAEEILDFMELERYRKQIAVNLPVGVQKLVGVARALSSRPKILLLDEPSCGLSRDEKEDLARFLLRIKYEKEIPTIWVEHDLALVGELSDNLLVLDNGVKVAEGPPEMILKSPEVHKAFGSISQS